MLHLKRAEYTSHVESENEEPSRSRRQSQMPERLLDYEMEDVAYEGEIDGTSIKHYQSYNIWIIYIRGIFYYHTDLEQNVKNSAIPTDDVDNAGSGSDDDGDVEPLLPTAPCE